MYFYLAVNDRCMGEKTVTKKFVEPSMPMNPLLFKVSALLPLSGPYSTRAIVIYPPYRSNPVYRRT